MYKSKKLTTIITVIISICSLFSGGVLYIHKERMIDGYEQLFLLPLVYLSTYLLFIRPIFKKKGISFFLAVYSIVAFFRYSILSYLIYKSKWYYGVSNYSPSNDQFNNAIIFMCYEVIIYSFAIYIFNKILIKKENENIIIFGKSNFIYTIFIFITIAIVLMNPSAFKYFSFITINENFESVDTLGTFALITIVFLSVSRMIIYFIVIKFLILKIKPRNYILSFFLVAIISIMNSMIFVGANRASFILNFLATIIILIYLYKKAAITFSFIMLALLPTLLGSLLNFRQTTTITQGTNKLIDLTDTLQVYLGGVYNVAISLDITSPNSNLLYLIIDIMRSAIGPSIFLKNINFSNSVSLYNERIFQSDLVSQIIPMIGQGNLYLGYVFAPILGVLFIYIATYFTKIIIEKSRFELIFVFTLINGRLGFVMAQNGNIFLNELTFYLPLFLIVYYFNNKVVIKNE